ATEIKKLLDLGEDARKKGLGFWPHLRKTVGAFDSDLRYRQHATEDDDGGRVLMPKLFRRLAAWAVNKRAKMLTGTFRTAKKDTCYLIDEFLEQGPPTAATPRNVDEFRAGRCSPDRRISSFTSRARNC